MRRFQLVELHDLPWFPAECRDALTDFMAWYSTAFRPYRLVVPLLAEALRSTGTTRIVDLCAGGGGRCSTSSRPSTARSTPRQRHPHRQVPQPGRLPRRRGALPGEVRFQPESVDAVSVPAELAGVPDPVRLLHHFPPEQARAILADAVGKHQGIAVLEITERRPLLWALPSSCPGPGVVRHPPAPAPDLAAPAVTYLLPLVPLTGALDGLVSVLRSYTVDELKWMTQGLDQGYSWRFGSVRSVGASRRPTRSASRPPERPRPAWPPPPRSPPWGAAP